METFVFFVHVVSAVVWAGATFTISWFVSPAVAASGPPGGAVMSAMINRTRFVLVMVVSSGLTVLFGIWMWAIRYGASAPPGLRGAALVVGALAGIAALVVGHGMQVPLVRKLGALTAEGPPSPEDAPRVQELAARITGTGNLLAWLLAVALIGMALSG